MTHWTMIHPRMTMEQLGYLPGFISETNPAPAAAQIDAAYKHGGGWVPVPGWHFNPDTRAISYPGDPPLVPLASTSLRDEILYFYSHAFLLILQPDGTFEVARVD